MEHCPMKKIGLGIIDTIEEEVSLKKLSSPAIIIIGEVVRESHKLRSFYQELQVNGSLINQVETV